VVRRVNPSFLLPPPGTEIVFYVPAANAVACYRHQNVNDIRHTAFVFAISPSNVQIYLFNNKTVYFKLCGRPVNVGNVRSSVVRRALVVVQLQQQLQRSYYIHPYIAMSKILVMYKNLFQSASTAKYSVGPTIFICGMCALGCIPVHGFDRNQAYILSA